ncbi:MULTISPECIES: 3D domain-containing protein [unclassified Cellulophaga]|uniref:3D domain-containing protein n=1 Tax=unclassified Cellulophaga TaxID=2634405 RepID=UPI0026E347E7|nr:MULTISPECIES: hypothetical protein [unclassified Cellulophaga]MDO6490948.1 hypothetical protein [Cellulophaga sp. 2_MG-2023]MDO6493858.1 hypothetical protein [Cellulophaga sp. 3_MG-2023]
MIKKLAFILCCIIVSSCSKTNLNKKEYPYVWKTLSVKATAYNSLAYQTSLQPTIAAWGDSLSPGDKYIAVSKDLLQLGLKRDTKVKLEGFSGIFLVKDKMHSKWRNRIDIYMGVDVEKAIEYGVKKINIQYKTLKDSLNTP